MSYNDMELNIEGELVSEPACVAAHMGATLQATLAGRVEGVIGLPASCKLSTLWGEAGRHGEW
jgi:hypothetical protein